jgi:hypothetical protein
VDRDNATSRGLWRGVRNAALLAIPIWLLFIRVTGKNLTLLAAGAFSLGEIVLLHLAKDPSN